MLKPILLTLLLITAMPAMADECGFEAYVRADFAAALKPLTECAQRGHAIAQFNLGVMSYNGRGVPQDYKAAVHWYKLSANQGYANAQYKLAAMYDQGEGVPQDYKAAVRGFTLSAKQGDAFAQAHLSIMYAHGQGVPQNYVLAHMWRNLAASNGENETSPKARDALASMMTPAQIAEAQALAQRCLASGYKDCR